MRILVLGSGGREHALCWKIAQSPKVKKLYCAPGNGGTAQIAQNMDIRLDDIDGIVEFAVENNIDLTVVGPELPLVEGIVDRFNENGLRIFGVNKKGAQLEGSKVYAKDFMNKYDIPTSRYREFKSFEKAIIGLEEFNYPLVIKADGLCLGKGVIICETKEEAVAALKNMMIDKGFGAAGDAVIIEEFLEGIEMSLLCFVSAGRIIPMESAKDYKQIFENDKGPNTGGVGCYSPNQLFNSTLKRAMGEKIINKIESGLKEEDINYSGILFIGLMITKEGPRVLEFNVRFGDPETEALIPRLKSDIVDIFEKTLDGSLDQSDLEWTNKNCITVVATSKGYPGEYDKGKEIIGLPDVDKDIIVFHNGTLIRDKKICTNGGRVISITALGDSLEEAREKAYNNLTKIHFDGMYFRRDIGQQ